MVLPQFMLTLVTELPRKATKVRQGGSFMTACIVGWAHTPFGRHDTDTVEGLIVRAANACATGSAAVHQGLKAIEAKAARIVLVVGVEQMTTTPGPEIGKNLLKASYVRDEADIAGGFAGIFGQIAALYFQKYGDQSDALARIAAKNHKNGVGNPYAQIRKDLGYDFCRRESDKNPFVAGPLKRTDCSLVSDGAAAVVLADEETARALVKAVLFRAAEQVN